MVKRYRVTYSSEVGRHHAVGVWAANSSAARQKVEGGEDVDHVVGVRRANGPVVAALVVLGVVVLLAISAAL